jgi:O-antigen/teichoic acid export membrane protein
VSTTGPFGDLSGIWKPADDSAQAGTRQAENQDEDGGVGGGLEASTARPIASDGDRTAPVATRVDGVGRSNGGRAQAEVAVLARRGMLSLGGSIASSVLAFALVVVITRGLGVRGAGIMFQAIALFTILSNVAELGADTGLLRFVASYRATGRIEDVRTTIHLALWPAVVVGSVLGGAMLVLSPELANVFVRRGDGHEAVPYIRLLALFVPLGAATTVALAGTRSFGTMIPYVGVQNIGMPLLRPLLVVGAIAAGLGAVWIVLGYAVPTAVGCAIAVGSLFLLLGRSERREPREVRRRSNRQLALEFWRFAAPRGVAAMFVVAMLWLNVLLVGALSSPRDAGIYAAGMRYVGLGTFALAALAVAIAPQISGLLARADRKGAEQVFQAGTWWLVALSFPLYLTLAAFAPVFMRVFGGAFEQGDAALVVLALASLTLVGTGNNKIVLLMGGRSGWGLASAAVAVALDVGLALVLVPRLGVTGAALAFGAAVVADNVITTVVVGTLMGVHPFGRGYWVVAVGSFVLFGAGGVVLRWVLGPRVSAVLALALIAGPAYGALLWRFRHLLQLPALAQAFRSRGGGDGRPAEALVGG